MTSRNIIPDNNNYDITEFTSEGKYENVILNIYGMFNAENPKKYVQNLECSDEEKNILNNFYKVYQTYLSERTKTIDYTQNYLPQSIQGANFFTNQIGIFYKDHTRNYNTPEIITVPIDFQNKENKTVDKILEESQNYNFQPTTLLINSFDSMNFDGNALNPLILSSWLYAKTML